LKIVSAGSAATLLLFLLIVAICMSSTTVKMGAGLYPGFVLEVQHL
jgi:hypothetical protein